MSQPSFNRMKEQLLIRRATARDRGTIYKMLCELENAELPDKEFKKIYLDNLENWSIAYLVVEYEGELVGFASCHIQLLLHHAAAVGEIQEMFVLPAYRSMGVGKRLVQELTTFAASRGASQLEVTTNKIRLDTHRFYEREGFENTHFKLVLNVHQVSS